MDNQTNTSWLEIDLSAIQNNMHLLQKMTSVPVMAVVKANAYGHGLVETALAAQAAGARWCGVARLEEGLQLRQGGVSLPILVLGYTMPDSAPIAAAERISVGIYDEESARLYAKKLAGSGLTLNVHVKIDSGMGRLGVLPEDGVAFTRFLAGQKGLAVEGLFTHFASADSPALPTTHKQIKEFQAVVDGLSAAGSLPEWVHASNSAGTLCFPEARYGMVRPGVALYGLNPSSEAPLPAGFRPALSWKARLISAKTLPTGHGVGYGHRYVTSKAERVGVIAMGYADGLRRKPGNMVLIRGKKVPVLGGVCMDQVMIALDDVPGATIGDEVVLVGSQGSAAIHADDVAQIWGCINYEVIATLAVRIPRLYL